MGERILLVDDSPDVTRVCAQILGDACQVSLFFLEVIAGYSSFSDSPPADESPRSSMSLLSFSALPPVTEPLYHLQEAVLIRFAQDFRPRAAPSSSA